MKLSFVLATNPDAPSLAGLHKLAADHLTSIFGQGSWSSAPSERAILADLRRPKFSRILTARDGDCIVAALRLATKKPWAIDVAYFSPAIRPLYLTDMVVHPDRQRQGVGRRLLREARNMAHAWPADTIRLNSYDAAAGAGPFYFKCGYHEVARVKYKGTPLVYYELLFNEYRDPGRTLRRVDIMIKLVYCIAKKSGLTDDEFFRYWMDIHGPLGARIPGLRKLVQSHRLTIPGDNRPPSFDGMAELWFDNIASLLAARQSPEWRISTEDEAHFVDHKRVAYFVSEEHSIVG